MRILDLCSGLGGASQAFLDAGHEVIRIDSDERFSEVPGTRIEDISQAFLFEPHEFDLIIFCPPCTEFSDGFHAPKSKANRAGEDYCPDLSIVVRGGAIINHLRPRAFVVENVRGSRPYFRALGMGEPHQVLGPFHLWGDFPHIILPEGFEFNSKQNISGSGDPLRAAKRAKWPLELSEAFLRAMLEQTTLDEWGA